MSKKTLFFMFLSVLAGLNLGTVRKSEDPVRDTQTNPILYEQKMEEEKDGKKGPLLYHVKNNPRETFFIDPPFEAAQKDTASEMSLKTGTSPEIADWWEEQPAPEPSSESAAFSDAVEQAWLDAVPQEKKLSEDGSGEEASVLAPPGGEAVSPATGSDTGEDYWW